MSTYITASKRDELVKQGELVEYGLHTQTVDWYINVSPHTMIAYLYSKSAAIKMTDLIESADLIARVFYAGGVTSAGYLMPVDDPKVKTFNIPEDLQHKLNAVKYSTTTSVRGAAAEDVIKTMIKRGSIFRLPEGCTIRQATDVKTRLSGANFIIEHIDNRATIQVRYDKEGGKIRYHEPRPSIYVETHERNRTNER